MNESAPSLPLVLVRRRTVLLILGLAAFLRIVWALLVPVIPHSDSVAYDTFSNNLVHGHGHAWAEGELTAYWPPGVSLIYAAVKWAFGSGYGPIVALQIIIGVATVGLCMHLASRWFGAREAIGAGILLAVWPAHIQFTTVLASEPWFSLFLVLALVAYGDRAKDSWRSALFAGLMLGAATLVRPTALLIPPMLLLVGWPGSWVRAGRLLAICYVGLFACVLPWTLRNQQVFGEFVLVSTNGGANFWMGNNPTNPEGTYTELPTSTDDMSEPARDRHLKDLAMQYIRTDPIGFVKRCLRRLWVVHDRETIGVGWNEKGIRQSFGEWSVAPLKLVSTAFWWVVLTLGLIGGALLIRRDGLPAFLHPTLLFWAYFAGVHMIIVAQDRYHWPSTPFIAILAGSAIARLRRGAAQA